MTFTLFEDTRSDILIRWVIYLYSTELTYVTFLSQKVVDIFTNE